MTPVQLELYFGILMGCFCVTFVPYLRKKYQEGTVEKFEYAYLITMLFSFITAVLASSALFLANPDITDFPFFSGLMLGLFDNFWVNEVKKLLNT